MAALLLDLFAALIYPGALTALLLGLVVGRLLGVSTGGGRAFRGLLGAWSGGASLAYAAAVILALLALINLPWPNLPWQTRRTADPWLLWALVETSVIAAALSGLASSTPTASRVAVREAQLGVAGRLVMWIGAGTVLSARNAQALPAGDPLLAALVVAALGALLALPAAAGWPPFSYEPFGNTSVYAALGDEDAALAQLANRLLSVFWLALLATVFVPLPRFPWWVDLPMRLGIVAGLASIARGLRGRFVNRPLGASLRWCWGIALPCLLVAVALLSRQ